MLEFVEASYRYPGGSKGVCGINLAIPRGGVTCLVGGNGSGKTTLFRLAAGLLRPQSGRVLLDGCDLRELPPRRRAGQIALLAQGTALPPQRAVEIVLSGRYPHRGRGIAHSQADLQAALEAMERTGCRELAECRVDRLSGGERQRVRLAAALAQDTAVLLLDEPTTYLDAAFSRETMALARALGDSGKTVVMVLHDLQLAMRWADRIAVLREGQMEDYGGVEELLSHGVLQRTFGVQIHGFRHSQELLYCVI